MNYYCSGCRTVYLSEESIKQATERVGGQKGMAIWYSLEVALFLFVFLPYQLYGDTASWRDMQKYTMPESPMPVPIILE